MRPRRQRGGGGGLGSGEAELAGLGVDLDLGAFWELALQDAHGEGVLDQALDLVLDQVLRAGWGR